MASSNVRPIIEILLEHAGIVTNFRTLFQLRTKFAKPDPDFVIASNRLGLAPEDCLVLEDSKMGS